MEMRGTSYRLNKREWIEIIEKLKNKNYSISELAKEYKINRSSIYSYCWRHRIFKKESKEALIEQRKQKFMGEVLDFLKRHNCLAINSIVKGEYVTIKYQHKK